MSLFVFMVCVTAIAHATQNINAELLAPTSSCERLQPPGIENPCDVGKEVDDVDSCIDNGVEINDFDRCKRIPTCCWRNASSPFLKSCFAKPRKCYVDLRLEKCYKRRGSVGYNGIFTGFSVNGSYCFVRGVLFSTQLGHVENHGFPIFNSTSRCFAEWEFSVTKLNDEKCQIHITNPKTTTLQGELHFNKACLHRRKYPFYFEKFGKSRSACVCTANAWLQPKDEYVSVSDEINDYIRTNEILSTCTQVLGMITRRSWMNRISLVNRKEVDEVMKALDNLTDSKKGNRLTTFDAKLLLQSTRKVTQYPFYEVSDENSAKDILQKTTSVMNNLIEAFANPIAIPRLGASISARSRVSHLKADQQTTRTIEQEDIRQELFDTLDAMSETIGARVSALKNHSEVTLRAVEERVNFSMVVTRSSKVQTLLEKSHLSDPTNTQSDSVTVLDIKTIKEEDANFNDTSVALVSIFYDYPVNPFESRVSKYLSVNVNEFIEGEPNKLSVPVNFTLTRASVHSWNKSMKPTCSFLGPNTSRENWQFHGCETTNHPSNNKTSCRCNHTTNFAILMKFTESELPEDHNKALQIISLILGSISIASLSVTVLIFVHYRKTLINDRMKIHFHLVVALLCGYVSLLSSSLFVSPVEKTVSIPCLLFAILTHFFFLAVYFWSLVEGIYLFYKIVLVFKQKSAEYICLYSPIIGWLLPGIIVSTTFGLSRTVFKLDSGKEVYAEPSTCFLSTNKTIWTFGGPVLFVLSVNLLILFKVMYVIFKSSFTSIKLSAANTSTRVSESLKQSTRGALILMPILGIPTIISLFYNLYTGDVDNASTTEGKIRVVVGTMGAYLQVILAGIQGFLIFLFYCVYNAEVKAAYNLATRRRKSVGMLEASQSKTRKQSRLPLLTGSDKTNECDFKASQSMTKTFEVKKEDASPTNSLVLAGSQTGAPENTKL